MNSGFWACIVIASLFGIIALVFAIMKGKSAKLISGFNTLPKNEQELYDKDFMVKDMRNSCFIWFFIMLVGAVGAYFISSYVAIFAFVIWGIVFFKDFHLDAHKAFNKYRLK